MVPVLYVASMQEAQPNLWQKASAPWPASKGHKMFEQLGSDVKLVVARARGRTAQDGGEARLGRRAGKAAVWLMRTTAAKVCSAKRLIMIA